MTTHARKDSRYIKTIGPSLKGWKNSIHNYKKIIDDNTIVQCGWGRVIFANTFASAEEVLQVLLKEKRSQRDIAFYVNDPHVFTSLATQDVFLDPSHTYRLWFEKYRAPKRPTKGVIVRRLQKKKEIQKVNAILQSRGMVPLNTEQTVKQLNSRKVLTLVAESLHDGNIVGFVTGIDHKMAFNDPENGSSLWSLAVSPNCQLPGVGTALVRYLVEFFQARGNSYLDLSVMHDNQEAIKMYEKLNFVRVPVYCVKRKNTINEKLFTPSKFQKHLNPYGQIIINEAARRGIKIDIIDKPAAIFQLTHGARSIKCRESLSDQTTSVAMSVCADKRVTHRVLKKAGIKMPKQISTQEPKEKIQKFIEENRPLVLKPASGEQGLGVKVGLNTKKEIQQSIKEYSQYYNDLILEEMVRGLDIRVIVINQEVVAAAKREPPSIVGDGRSKISTLINKLSRRRAAATGGESKIPIDDETLRVLKANKKTLDSVLPMGEELKVRNTANVHTGGLILDITEELPTYFKEIALKIASSLEIPVVGLDFMIPDLNKKKYWLIEANERPGLANHEPQPTAEKFIDFLFPMTKKEAVYEAD